ncbi:holin family protein [Turicibacter sanguinis]|uniref:phage holin family protein n=1 Tax=Turicibacter sanguinis TaxID=154288 RepID=UPI0018AB3AFB|nr:phage holin family protein [Turicibacter sanguinis]MDB8552148.1 phage holin family protein [Turicibacter sanguinis]
MKIYNERMNTMMAFVGTAFTWLFGAWDLALAALITAMALDYLTGVTRSVINGDGVNSEKGFKGLLKKITILYVVVLAVLIDRLIGQGWVFRSLVCFWYAANEGISVLENVASLGLPVPEPLINALEQLKQGNKKELKESK